MAKCRKDLTMNTLIKNMIKESLRSLNENTLALDRNAVNKLKTKTSSKVDKLKQDVRVSVMAELEKQGRRLITPLAKKHDVLLSFVVVGTNARGESVPHIRVSNGVSLSSSAINDIIADLKKAGFNVIDSSKGRTELSINVDIQSEIDRVVSAVFE